MNTARSGLNYVYYANCLKFIERGRSEWVRELGIDQNSLKEVRGIVFAVRRVEADYLSSARLMDELTVVTEMGEMRSARFVMDQQVRRGAQVLFTAKVTIVTMTPQGRPTRLPEDVRSLMQGV